MKIKHGQLMVARRALFVALLVFGLVMQAFDLWGTPMANAFFGVILGIQIALFVVKTVNEYEADEEKKAEAMRERMAQQGLIPSNEWEEGNVQDYTVPSIVSELDDAEIEELQRYLAHRASR